MPYDFFMSRYKAAYVAESVAFIDALVNDKPSPCSGEDGLVALVMSIAAGLSAERNEWVKFDEVLQTVKCDSPTSCEMVDATDLVQAAAAAASAEAAADTAKKSGFLQRAKWGGRAKSWVSDVKSGLLSK